MSLDIVGMTHPRFTVRSSDPSYSSPMIGNGQVVTVIGPTGYHGGLCPKEEMVDRTIFWAGRRLKDARGTATRFPRTSPEELIGPTIPLVRFGRLDRGLRIDGKETTDDDWEQTFEPAAGRFLSTLRHGRTVETTESLVCLTANLLVFHTRLSSSGAASAQVEFQLDFAFGDADGRLAPGTRLHVTRPHPDDLGFGGVEGTRTLERDLEHRPPHERESLSVQYDVDNHLGEVRIGRWPLGEIHHTDAGGRLLHRIPLEPGRTVELWFWVALSDRLSYLHFPRFEELPGLLRAHGEGWRAFWEQSVIEVGNPDVEAIRTTCLYTLRCNSTPWTCPPGVLASHWEGRTFHDDFFSFHGLLTSGYQELAEKIPAWRLSILPLALERGIGHGAYYGWEVTETGEESAPYGHFTDEMYRHGNFSEQPWRYFLHTGNVADLRRFYPVMRGCAEWLAYDLLIRDASGRLQTRRAADIAEHVMSATNSIFNACSAVRALDNAARAAELLGVDPELREKWRSLATELRQNLPRDSSGRVYRYADDSDLPPEPAHLAMVYPFSFDVDGERSRNTFDEVWKQYEAGWKVQSSELVLTYNWIWTTGRFATLCFYLGEAEKGWRVLQRAPSSLGPFLAPNEHFRADGGAYLPWFVTGSGAFVHALNAMFVQVYDEQGARLLAGVPDSLGHARFRGLPADKGVRVSGQLVDGRLTELVAGTGQPVHWRFQIPRSRLDGVVALRGVRLHAVNRGWVQGVVTLKAGDTPLFRGT